jgi:dihydropteroate synthase
MINDVRALRRPGALQAAADSSMAVCLMHMQGEPGDMQDNPRYGDVVQEVYDFLAERMRDCLAAGIEQSRLCVDPGFGFGKTHAQNYRLLRELARFGSLGVPVLAGISRKSMIGVVTGRSVVERLPGSIAAAVFAVQAGAGIIRVHDVAATCDALKVLMAVRQAD